MSLAEPFLWPQGWPLLAIVPISWLLLSLRDRNRMARLARLLGPRFAGLAGDLHSGERKARRAVGAAALLLALLALLQPVWGEETSLIEQRGIDLLVCLDVSRSMLAGDIEPSRLERAKVEIRTLAERLESEPLNGDRLGLVLFAGEARLAVPLTSDIETFVELLEEAGPLSIPRGGTDLGAALDRALEALGTSSGEHETVLLITDGEDHQGRGLAAAGRCRERGITVHGVGLGTALGSKIALRGKGGETFLLDRAGHPVVSAMDPESLRRVARAAGGEFVDAGVTPRSLVALYQRRIVPMASKALAATAERTRRNRFQWPLLAAFGLWILALCLTDRRHR